MPLRRISGGAMFTYRNSLLLTVVACALVTGPTLVDGQSSHPQRDPRLLDVLSRVIAASGGPQVLASVRDVTESGEITFSADEPVRSPVSIRLLGGHHFRMEADGPEGKRTWVVKNGVGSLREADGEVHSISYDNAVNLGNLTFPLSHFATALSDVRTDVSLLGIENREGRSVYRLETLTKPPRGQFQGARASSGTRRSDVLLTARSKCALISESRLQ